MKEFSDINKNLEILAEECAEVIQIKSKIIRFGFLDRHPRTGIVNQMALHQEIGDVLAMVDILIYHKILSQEHLVLAKEAKLKKLKEWYNHGS